MHILGKKRLALSELLEDIVYMFGGVLLALVVYQGLIFVLGTPEPIVTVVSQSMEPTLMRGDMLVLRGASVDTLRAGMPDGNIIVYVCPHEEPKCPPGDKLIVHRVYSKNPDGTLTSKGDNNPAQDQWRIQPSWIKGKMILRLPYLGYPRIIISEILNI